MDVERGRRFARLLELGEAGDLLQEEGVSARLGHQATDVLGALLGWEQRSHERFCRIRRKRSEVQPGLGTDGLFRQHVEARAPLLVLTPVRENQEHDRCVGRPQDVPEQARRVEVSPLQVVDVDDERPSVADALEELPQRAKA